MHLITCDIVLSYINLIIATNESIKCSRKYYVNFKPLVFSNNNNVAIYSKRKLYKTTIFSIPVHRRNLR